MKIDKKDSILVLGARGLVGSAIGAELSKQGYKNLLTPSHKELELLDQREVLNYFKTHAPDHVVIAAAKVGGIYANNTYRADFIFQNITIEANVFNAAFATKIKRLLFLGSSCIYPTTCPRPIKEEYLLTGVLEPTNEPYALAKIVGLKMVESFRRQYGCDWISAMPTNLYGINDNFHPENSHVIPGLIVRMKKAIDNHDKEFPVWGSGKPRREFLYVDDLARACVMLMEQERELPYFLNVGTGEDVTVGDLVKLIAELMQFKGEIVFDTSKPDGMMTKVMDVSKIKNLGWQPQIDLRTGLKMVIENYLAGKSH